MKVAVLHAAVAEQAAPDEEDVLEEVAHVSEALNRLGYEPISLPFSIDIQKFMDRLLELRPAFVFNLVDCVEGKGHLIHLAPALLDFLNIPYTGAGTDAIYLTSNKLLAKQWLVGSGIATPQWCRVEDFLKVGIPFSGPYIVKSVWEHASIGLDEDSVAPTPDLLRGIIQRVKPGGGWFAEVYIEGREFNISLLAGENGPEVLPLAEIQFVDYAEGKPRIVGYRAKWDSHSFEFGHTVRRFDFPDADHHLLEHLARIAQDCWQIFGLSGYCRVDFRVDAEGKPWVLEVNANPCISPDSGFVAAATRKGLHFDQVLARIIRDSLDRWELPADGNEPQ
jgi:D-alanine-D-alanine ligase